MTDERDPKVSRRYRELGGEEPPRALDESILAAARKPVDRPHAPLVTPAGRHRWYFPLAAAAILVLAVALTVQVERLQPDPEAVTAAPVPEATPDPKTAAREAPPSAAEQRSRRERADARKPLSVPESPPAFTPDPKPAAQEAPRELARAARPADPSAMAADAVGQDRGVGTQMGSTRTAPQANVAESQVAATAVPLSPERLLERIVELRKEGRHNEADQALAEFRQRYPDYRISEEMLRKVERRK